MIKAIFLFVVLFGTCYSFWYAYYLIKDKNKLGAAGMILVGLLISFFSLMVKLK